MSGNFDQIRKKQLLLAPETINTNWISPSTSLDDRVGAFSLSLKYENGTGVNMRVFVQLSNDNQDFGDITGTLSDPAYIDITDNTGTALFDLEGSGAAFIRLRIEVTSGSIDAISLLYNALQFH